jgi:hypothetical protein
MYPYQRAAVSEPAQCSGPSGWRSRGPNSVQGLALVQAREAMPPEVAAAHSSWAKAPEGRPRAARDAAAGARRPLLVGGQVLRFEPRSKRIVGLTVINARWLLDRDGQLTVHQVDNERVRPTRA